MSSKDPVWDYASQKYVRWSSSRRCWLDERGRPTNPPERERPASPPQVTPDVTSTTTSSSRNPESSTQPVLIPSRASGPNVRDTTDKLRSMTVGSPSTHGTSSGGQHASLRTTGYSSNVPDQQAAQRSTSQTSGTRPAASYLPVTGDQRTVSQYGQQSSSGRGTGYATTSSDPRTGAPPILQGSSGRGTGYVSAGVDLSTGPRNIGTTTASADLRPIAQAPAHSSSVHKKAAYSATLSDKKTGIQTRWEVSETTPYVEPGNEGSNRGLNVKHIRQVEGRRDGQSKTPGKDYKTYRVIEVALVPPEDTTTSNVSRITPTDEGVVVRNRRFVIVREIPERNVFEALAIKTYNGRGVAAPGVIKSHHSIIYTPPAPSLLANEQPGRTARGDVENGMQPHAIRVVSYDRGRALDPLSRLDYADRYEFDWGVPNISVFGRVHEDSHAALFVQYNSVWQSIRTAVSGHLGAPVSTPTTSTATGPTVRGGANTASSNPPGPSSTAATQGSSRADTAGSTASAEVVSNARALLRRYAQRDSGPCSDYHMSVILWYLQEYARRKNLQRPALTAQQIQDYARNAERRAAWIQTIWSQWGERQESSSDEDSNQDSDSSDSDED